MWSIKGFEKPHFLSQAVDNVQRDSENGNGMEHLIKAKVNPVIPDFQQTPPVKYSPREGDNLIFQRCIKMNFFSGNDTVFHQDFSLTDDGVYHAVGGSVNKV